jgi:DNA-binding transcriptional MerR regulator
MSKLFSISEVSKILKLINSSNNKPLNHILRYWEKEFKQIRPKKINNRRYYSNDQVEIIKLIKFLLKTKGMTISGVKNLLNLNINKLDDYDSDGLKANYYKKIFKEKSVKLLDKIKKLKKYGKKNSFKSKNGS